MDIFQSFIMGLVQGLTEFLPVSSSGHMILAAKLLGTAPSLATELVFHIATLAAVIVFYRKKILSLLKKPLQKTTFLLLICTRRSPSSRCRRQNAGRQTFAFVFHFDGGAFSAFRQAAGKKM